MFKHSFKVLLAVVALMGVQASAPLEAIGNVITKRPDIKSQIIVNNRLLAKVHGKVFSVLDVKKAMDNYLGKAYPEIFNEPEAVLQFYVRNWRPILQEMIDNELMLMEAEELSYKMDKIHVREEMESRFGSNLIEFGEKVNKTQSELEQLVSDDLICKSLMWYRVWQRAFNEVTPQIVHDHYTAHLQNSPSDEQWTYQMCTIRGKDADATAKIAEDVRALFEKTDSSLGSSLADAVAAVTKLTPSGVSVKLSDDIVLTSQELSKENLSILESLKPMEISNPVNQKSRYDDQTVTRLFHLKDHTLKAPPAFDEVSDEIRDALVGKKSESIRQEYMNRLRKRFCCEDLVVEKMYGPETKLFVLHG